MSRIPMESSRKTGDELGGFREFEEDMYCSHFHTFFKILSGRFHHHLAIPNKFVKNLRKKLSGNVVLQGPSGDVWNVGITAFGSNLYFMKGWNGFVQDNSLEENDALIFKYSGNSCFDVMMFDRKSSCQKETLHFVKRCKQENDELDGNEEMMDQLPAKTLEVSGKSACEVLNESPTIGKRHKRDVTGVTSESDVKPLILKANNQGNIQKEYKGLTPRNLVCGQECLPNRRPATIEKKKKALNEAIALAAETEASFVMHMSKSHVLHGFYMSIPVQWAKRYLTCRSQYKYVNLQVEDNRWHVKLNNRINRCGLSGGWKTFAIENYLEQSDVLVFSLINKTADTVTLNVRIFRVVEKNIEAKQAMPPASRRVIVGGFLRRRRQIR